MLHNFGGRTPWAGDLDGLVLKATKALDAPSHGGLVGMGLTMEGINPKPSPVRTDVRPNVVATGVGVRVV